MYLPGQFPHDFYSKSYQVLNSLRLYVRRVFITNDLGPDFLPKWLNWLKVVVDADDLPLNVGRDSLQNNKGVVQIKRTIARKVGLKHEGVGSWNTAEETFPPLSALL